MHSSATTAHARTHARICVCTAWGTGLPGSPPSSSSRAPWKTPTPSIPYCRGPCLACVSRCICMRQDSEFSSQPA